MKRPGRVWLATGAVVAGLSGHVLLSACPNGGDAAVDIIREAGGAVRRTPRLLWLSTATDAEIYPRGDIWNVELRDAEVGEELAGRLASLRSLTDIDLHGCRVPPGMTANLIPPSVRLRSVTASNTNLGDDQLCGLSGCPNLVYLILDGTDITDGVVATIARCRLLGYIVLRRSKLTAAGVAAIRAAHPDANIVTD